MNRIADIRDARAANGQIIPREEYYNEVSRMLKPILFMIGGDRPCCKEARDMLEVTIALLERRP